MATMTIRSTYALDLETTRKLEDMARRWGVSKSEALRRAIRAAAGASADGPPGKRAIAALDALQRDLALTPSRARSWIRAMREERRAFGRS